MYMYMDTDFLVIFNFLTLYTWNYTPGIKYIIYINKEYFTFKIFRDLHLTSSQIQNFIWISAFYLYNWTYTTELYMEFYINF